MNSEWACSSQPNSELDRLREINRELLEACEAALREIEELLNDNLGGEERPRLPIEKQLRAAIQKAKGQ